MRFRYQDLRVTEDIHIFIEKIYTISSQFPAEERYALMSQARRAATSILLNLAEGSARNSPKDFSRFITISLGSLTEVHACLSIAMRQAYITQVNLDEVNILAEGIWFKLQSLRNSQTIRT